jgi:response regulator RpfG family c-di-GMP phosphodiesterase
MVEDITDRNTQVSEEQLSILNHPYWGQIQSYMVLLEMKSPLICAHCKRVGILSRKIGEAISLPHEELSDLEAAGVMHDIGFLGVPSRDSSRIGLSDITGNPHPVIGYMALARVATLERIANAVLYHHEKYNGTGYPHKIAGDTIPLFARVIAVADLYDLFMYFHPPTMIDITEETRKLLVKERSVSLDPEITNKFLFHLAATPSVKKIGESEVELTVPALRTGMVLSRDLKTIGGVLLVKAGTIVTKDLLDRIIGSGNIDWLISVAYVKAESIREEPLLPEIRAEEAPIATVTETIRSSTTQTAAPKETPHILAADDSIAVTNALRRELGLLNIRVTGVTTIEAASNALANNKFDAIITDLIFSGASGFTLLEEIQHKYPYLHCIVLSGYPSPDNIRLLRNFPNVVRFITKPWSQQTLITALNEAIDKTKAARRS